MNTSLCNKCHGSPIILWGLWDHSILHGKEKSLLCVGITPILGIRGLNPLVLYNILQNLFFFFFFSPFCPKNTMQWQYNKLLTFTLLIIVRSFHREFFNNAKTHQSCIAFVHAVNGKSSKSFQQNGQFFCFSIGNS